MITLPKMPQISKGKFGSYQNLDDAKGIKIFYKLGLTIRELWDLNSKVPCSWKSVLKEATIISKIQVSDLTPSYFGFKIVKIRNKYYPAILMEHIEGEHLIESHFKFYTVHKDKIRKEKITNNVPYHGPIQQYVRQKFLSYNFDHSDLHFENILITKDKKIKVIDYSPEFCSFLVSIKGSDDIDKSIADEYLKEYNESILAFKTKIKEKDKTLFNQAEINYIANKYWDYVHNLSCDDNKISFYISNYNEKRKKCVVNYMQRECSKILKKKLQMDVVNVNEMNAHIQLILKV